MVLRRQVFQDEHIAPVLIDLHEFDGKVKLVEVLILQHELWSVVLLEVLRIAGVSEPDGLAEWQVGLDKLLDQVVHPALFFELVKHFIPNVAVAFQVNLVKGNLLNADLQEVLRTMVVEIVVLQINWVKCASRPFEQLQSTIVQFRALNVILAAFEYFEGKLFLANLLDDLLERIGADIGCADVQVLDDFNMWPQSVWEARDKWLNHRVRFLSH